jgi:hypothetical protein
MVLLSWSAGAGMCAAGEVKPNFPLPQGENCALFTLLNEKKAPKSFECADH